MIFKRADSGIIDLFGADACLHQVKAHRLPVIQQILAFTGRSEKSFRLPTEVLPKRFQKLFSDLITASANTRTDRRGDITFVNGKVPSVLMEVAFIDNSASLGKYLNRRDKVAEGIAKALVKASRVAKLQR